LLSAVFSTSSTVDVTWQLQGFTFNLPAGFSRVHATEAFQFISKNGVGLTVDAIPVAEHAAQSEQINKWVTYAEKELPRIANRHGTITVPLSKDVLQSGSVLCTLGESSKSSAIGQRFGLFFVLVSPKGNVVQMVFEGSGDPVAAMSTFRPYVASASWGG
jgi:hypothetical protein